MARPRCPGVIVTDVNGVPACLDMVGGAPVPWEEIPEFDIAADLDPVLGAEYFAAGFVIIGTCWVIGFSVRAILKVIRS